MGGGRESLVKIVRSAVTSNLQMRREEEIHCAEKEKIRMVVS